MVSNIALWNRIACFTPDDPCAAYRFTDRLARENGWSKAFTLGAVEEYKKFVYLAAVSTRRVSPSDAVDQVWHLHLTFTHSYWDDLCGTVVGRALHHNPGRGGRAEAARLREQYAHTLALYRDEFGCAAPARYWPTPRVRTATPMSAIAWALAGAAALATAGAAYAAVEPVTAGTRADRWLLVGGLVLAVICVGALIDTLREKKKKEEGDNGSDFEFDFARRRKSDTDKDDADGDGDGGGDGGGGGGCGD